MPNRRLAAVLSAAVVALAVAQPAAAQMMQHQMDEVDNPADKAFIGAMRDMMVGMHKGMPTGDTDKDFVRLMLPHHELAVEMARTELQYGHDPILKTLAQEIVASQQKEIATLKDWLAKHGG